MEYIQIMDSFSKSYLLNSKALRHELNGYYKEINPNYSNSKFYHIV